MADIKSLEIERFPSVDDSMESSYNSGPFSSIEIFFLSLIEQSISLMLPLWVFSA
uniref:Uncharacterized protein n=1 Tax=Arundo donax TaxID=35708 RepID=A0A0A9DH00_ARUDO